MADRRIMVPAKMTGDVISSYRVLKGTFQIYRPELLNALAERFRMRPATPAAAEGEDGFGLLVDTVEMQLDEAYDNFIVVDRAHRLHEARLEVSRESRDELRAEVSTKVTPARGIAEHLFGTSASHLLGFGAQTSGGFDLFLEQASTLSAILRDSGDELEPKLVGYNADRATLGEEIGTATDRLKKLGEEAELQRRSTELSMLRRRDALAGYDRTADGAAEVLKALFRMAGLPEHAQRVERTIPRRSPQPADTGEEGAEGPAEGETPNVEPTSEVEPALEPTVEPTVEAAPETPPTRVVTPWPWPMAVPTVGKAEPGSDPRAS